MDRRKLKDIVADLSTVLFEVDEMQGELDDDLEADLDAMTGEFSDKANAILHTVEINRTQANMLKERGKQLIDRSKTINANMDRLEAWLKDNMQLLGLVKVDCLDYPKLSIRKSPARLVVENENVITAEYWVPQPSKINKAALKADIKKGKELPGVSLVQGTRLSW
ncbi:MAG: hypothetical protein GY847_29030 [Proteobacteria bacterium]|nr:hypothetical protein [Pseudomonadota bacterium]